MKEAGKTAAVMVLYNPDWDVTTRAINMLLPQVDHLCLIDNSPDADHSARFKENPDISYFPLGRNAGIAAAQNVGVGRISKMGYDYILFSDQDSEAPLDVVEKLLTASEELESRGVRVAAVGTRAFNKVTGTIYRENSKHVDNDNKRGEQMRQICSDLDVTEYYSVRSSISLISTRVMKEVGEFDESLFIDGVDHEWCWRAWHKSGRRSFIVEKARIDHMLGEGDREVMGEKVSIPSPFRVYYQFRNYLWLRKRKYVPSYWKKQQGMRYMLKALYYPIMVAPRHKYLKNIFRGVREGLSSPRRQRKRK